MIVAFGFKRKLVTAALNNLAFDSLPLRYIFIVFYSNSLSLDSLSRHICGALFLV